MLERASRLFPPGPRWDPRGIMTMRFPGARLDTVVEPSFDSARFMVPVWVTSGLSVPLVP